MSQSDKSLLIYARGRVKQMVAYKTALQSLSSNAKVEQVLKETVLALFENFCCIFKTVNSVVLQIEPVKFI